MKNRPFLTLLLCFTISLTSLKPKSFEEVKGTVVWEMPLCFL